ncbi:hypothetical protein E5F05_11975 [Deinococcus metallilatus]|uniref:Uncharacterized protein n=1 Tax=Deinococcus metallilatus TaxID=1211322 RepID=A0AAJ5JXE3_9DEIO|nr:hypothetical protein [Deinococcus metallilatus]MBB5295247.1 hypothetical protein [Deinococcus metallilatus]QBY08592.1 hypothetical protein E5F05_11975 [Deinococcus metallilatus]RXJ10854.1 hypothetical protein ERJ73_10800 [Deinococcus metallilatus]TLK22189.1 hypothetical protein FCS05_18235 [Deinococcus metallilatus]GMA15021.1 hypothetical protein GCM10025871_13520 [Deinococcus metallilatus]
MNKRFLAPILTTLLSASALPALAQAAAAPPAPLGNAWSAAALAGAKYVILDPRIEGNPNIVNDEQRAGILTAMKRDSAGAIKRHYPNATIVTDAQTPGVVKVTPVLVTPNALLPWAKLTARLDFDLGSGQRVILNDQFGLLTLWQYQAEAANYLYGELVKKLP